MNHRLLRSTPIVLVALCAFATACAHDVRATYPGAGNYAGSIQVVLNDATSRLTVTVNDALVVDRAHSRKARIDGVPAGAARVTIATGGRCEAAMLVEHEVQVLPGQVTTIPLPGPEPNTGCMVWSGLYYVGLNIGIVAVAIAMGAGGGKRH